MTERHMTSRIYRALALAALILPAVSGASRADRSQTPPVTNERSRACPSAPSDFPATPREFDKPTAGERADATIHVGRLLSLDFSPFDAQILRHGRDLTLIFNDNAVIVFHGVADAGKAVDATFRLPDGSVVSLCALLQAAERHPTTGNVPQLKIPPATKIPGAP